MTTSVPVIRCKGNQLWQDTVLGCIVGIFFIGTSVAGVVDNTQYITSRIINYRNTSYNPCENIYAFACGNYLKANVTPPIILQPSLVANDITDLIQNGGSHRELKPFKLIEDLYKTCMDDNAVGQEVLALLDRILKKLGNWPVFEDGRWKESDFDWIDFTIGSKKLGLDINYFLDLKPWRVMEFNKTVVRYMIDIAPAEFKDSSDPLVAAYAKYIQSVFALLKNKKNSSREISEIIEFERQVSKINLYNSKDIYTEKLTLEDLVKKWPTINWNELISNIILRNLKAPVKITEIFLWSSQAVSDFVDLVLKTPNHVKANYAVWKIIQKTIPHLTEKYRVLHREYCLVQKCENTTRAHSCVGVLKRHLAPAVNLLYAKSHHNSDSEALVTDIIRNMKDELVRMINESWMSQEAKQKNVEIVRNKEFVIGFKGKDDDWVKFYENLEIDTSNYLQALLDLELFAIENRFNETDFDGEAKKLFEEFLVSSLYGKIYIPWSSLRKPFFDVSYPLYVNYASIGSYIAYELIKSVDNLEDFTKDVENEKAACFRNQWSIIDNFNLNDHTSAPKIRMALNAQIVAQMGMKIAYLTYRRVAQSPKEEVPFQLTYTNHQLFWINLAQNFCQEDPQHEPKTIDHKYTSFEYFFSKAVTSAPEIYDDFNCSDKSFAKNYGTSCSYL
ncbi:GSCOCG00013486001-RA-CDS [Cotesia congregata]|nr:GSCOCG00013486001-RA-CDS [Cotesia congregata]